MQTRTDAGTDAVAPSDMTNHSSSAVATVEGHAYARPLRALVGTLVGLVGASLWLIFAAVVLGTLPLTPLGLILLMLVVALPWAVACLLARTAAATLAVARDALVIDRPGLRAEVPTDAIAGIAAWRIPLPGPGITLTLRSGARLRWGLELRDPVALLAALASAGVDPARAAQGQPVVVWAHARGAGTRPWRWYHYTFKFVVFGALPAAVVFNAHQHIVYGGTLGQYYMYGLWPYLGSLTIHWAASVAYLVLWAAVLRGLAEAWCLLVAAVVPTRAAAMRRLSELGCAAGYYGAVPVLLGIRFLA